MLILGALFSACSNSATTLTTTEPAADADTLVIWWERGYYAQEDEAIEAVVNAWEQETGNSVEIKFLDQDTVLKETENALKSGRMPDIVHSLEAEHTLIPAWAWEGELADVSKVIDPLRDRFNPTAIQSVQYYNSTAQQRIPHAIPLKQQTIHIHYWRDLLAEAGLDEADIPTEWDAFWDFWKQAQDNLRDQGKSDVYGLGLAMSKEASDTYATFHQVLEAYDVELLDADGNLQVDDPDTREKIAAALDWYSRFYTDGYVPEVATEWTDSGNNGVFLNRELLMVVNPTLSIPGSQREDDEDIYFNQIATIEFPNEPDGESPTYLVNTNQILIFEEAPNKALAEDFLSYLIQPENLAPYLEGSLGRFFPVMAELTETPFWNDATDPHISTGTRVFTERSTRPGYHTLNVAYSEVDINNVWGQAIESIVLDGVSPTAAADQAIAEIQTIFEEWQQ
ncbi:MAG: ABC transporter substrate-binding protein [Cyanobacteria bacterium J06629_9]